MKLPSVPPQRKATPYRPRRRRTKFTPTVMLEVLTEALKKSGLSEQALSLRLQTVWREVVGENIAENTIPLNISRGVFLVQATTPTWQNELTFLKQDLIDKLNAALGSRKIKQMKVIAGARKRPPPKKAGSALVRTKTRGP